ncbi:MAG: RND transporter [Proteobacteria bacterium]|nr:RND transporter [Pseudomonadota bacterium]
MFRFIDNFPYPILIILALFMGLAPFRPMPHLWEKILMLRDGNLTKPLDIFDLFLHATPFVFLIIKVIRDYIKS